MWAIPFLDLGLPERPVVLHVAVFVLLTVASTALARVILRNGAPQPAPAGHTP
jgi:hypothetical protein